MPKAVFLDRDGTIIEDVNYLNHPKDITFIKGSIEAIRKLNQAGYLVIVITNQAGIARGYLSEDMLQTIDKVMHKQILNQHAHLDAIYYCPHHPEYGEYPYKQTCDCRKPEPGMILNAQKHFNIDLKRSFMVGDKDTDIETGQKAGIKTIQVLTGKGNELPAEPDHTANDLADAVNWILSQ